jgi:hypothetical protein
LSERQSVRAAAGSGLAMSAGIAKAYLLDRYVF